MKVREVMHRDVWTVPATLEVAELGRQMTARRVSGAPVVDDQGQMLGVVSLHALAAAGRRPPAGRWGHYWDMGTLEDALLDSFSQEGFAGQGLVRDIMMPALYTVSADANLVEAADMLISHRIHRVLVTERGRVVGIVTNTDLVRVLRDMLKVTA